MNERSIFMEALEEDAPARRSAFLDQACGGDAALRRRVEALLQSHEQAGEFLAKPAPERLAEGMATPGGLGETQAAPAAGSGPSPEAPGPCPIPEVPGSRIGPYRLVQPIGEGGMGVVWMAEQQEPVQRRVALKVVKPGMDSRQVIARFEAERQALALMDHPHIARVLDAGATEGGRPYFVMELVKGVPLTLYCDQRRLTPRERLRLFVPVCQAVQHAHQKGVIHRDLKPSNVLISLSDGKPAPKVIDFGVAKATGARLTDKTLLTECGQVVGTLEYMSPEQAELNPLDVDTRSDVYALGVLLYELLTGTPPLEPRRLKETALLEVLRLIREEEPPRPSVRLSAAEGLASIAANRGLQPKQLGRQLRGELDWIVLKALEKDRNRRYETAGALAADVQRHLNDEPVQACPPSAGYRFRKFVRRNKRVLLAAALVGVGALALLALAGAGVVFSAYQRAESAFQAETAARKAEAEAGEEKELFHYYHRVALAHQAWRDGQVGQADQLLDQCPGRLRQWEWHYLKRLCHAELLSLEGHGVGVMSVAFSPDGKGLATGGADRKLVIRDGATGRARLVLTRHALPIRSVTYSPDGKLLASLGAGATGELKVWDAASGKEAARFPTDLPPTDSVAFSPDGRRLATCDARGTEDPLLRIWDAADGKELFSWRGHPGGARGVAFSPDGKYLASAGSDRLIKLWDAGSYQHVRSLRAHQHRPLAAAFSRDGKQLASAGEEGGVKIWDPATGREVLSLPGHTREALAVAFSPDGTRLASGGGDDAVRLWDLSTGEELGVYRGHRGAIAGVTFSPHGQRLASSGGDGTLKVWDATRNPEALVLKGPSQEILSAAFGPAGSRLATAGADRTLRIWDLSAGRELRSAPVPGGSWGPPHLGAAFSADGRRLAAPADGGGVVVWDGASGERLLTLRGHARRVFSAALSADGRRVASASYDQTVKVWDVDSGRELVTLVGHTDVVHWAAFSPDGGRLASGGLDATVKIWDLTTGRELVACRGHAGRICSLSFSPDGARVASGDGDGTVKLWDAAAGRELFSLTHGRTGEVVGLAFTPDGRRLASLGQDGSLKLWDASTGQNTLSLRGPMYGPYAGRVHVLAFSPDGGRLVSDQLFGVVRVWDATPDSGAGPAEPLQDVPPVDPPGPAPTREQTARRAIEQARRDVAAQPESAPSCNGLAWAYLTAPEPLRDVKAALPLAEKAVRLAPGNATYRNTLGVAYYRAGRYREAVELLRPDLASQTDSVLACDLYILAMSCHRLGDTARARDYYDWAFRWEASQHRLTVEQRGELSFFRVEAEELLGIGRRDD
jgi:WD40 repeat protein/serine/threonine protein kinase